MHGETVKFTCDEVFYLFISMREMLNFMVWLGLY